MNRIRYFIALYMAKIVAVVIGIVSKGRGTNMPGAVALKIDPDFLRHVKGLDVSRTVFITGTNGKSTTTNLVAHVFRSAGFRVAANLSGANLLAGTVVALTQKIGLSGRLNADIVIMETDERYLPIIYKQLPAQNICIINLQKDQVQRNGEPDLIYRKIESVINEDMTVFVNHDEPNARSLGKKAGRCINYGVQQNSKSFNKDDDFFSVTMPCPICHSPITFKAYNIDNIGPFVCKNCGFGEEKEADFLARDVDFEKQVFYVGEKAFNFKNNTPYFLYCYIAAVAIASQFGIDNDTIAKAFDDFVNIKGRTRENSIGVRTVRFVKMKQENPETLQSAINLVAEDERDKLFLYRLDEWLDFYPPYTNTFYLYDCDFRGLLSSGSTRCFCIAEVVRYEIALRLLYDGFDTDALKILPERDYKLIAEELLQEDCGNIYISEEIPKLEAIEQYL